MTDSKLVPRPDGHGALMQGGREGKSKNEPKGMPEETWRKRVQNRLKNSKLLWTMEQIATGGVYEKYTDKMGKIYYTETRNADRIAAAKFLADQGYKGLPKQKQEKEEPPASPAEHRAKIVAILPRLLADLGVKDHAAVYQALGLPMDGEAEEVEEVKE